MLRLGREGPAFPAAVQNGMRYEWRTAALLVFENHLLGKDNLAHKKYGAAVILSPQSYTTVLMPTSTFLGHSGRYMAHAVSVSCTTASIRRKPALPNGSASSRLTSS